MKYSLSDAGVEQDYRDATTLELHLPNGDTLELSRTDILQLFLNMEDNSPGEKNPRLYDEVFDEVNEA